MMLIHSMNYANEILQAELELDNALYEACLVHCRKLVENAHKDLYRNLLLRLRPEESQQVRDVERRKGNGHFESFTLGPMLGLFQEARLYDQLHLLEIQGDKLKTIRLDDVLRFGNDAAHKPVHIGRHQAGEAFYATRRFLELGGLLDQRQTLYTAKDVYRELLLLAEGSSSGSEAKIAYLAHKADELKISRQQEAELREDIALQFRQSIQQDRSGSRDPEPLAPSPPEREARLPNPTVPSNDSQAATMLVNGSQSASSSPLSLQLHAQPIPSGLSIHQMRDRLGERFLCPEVFSHPRLAHLELDLAQQRAAYERARQFKFWANYLAGLVLSLEGQLEFTAADIQNLLRTSLLPEHFGQRGAAIGSLLSSDVEKHSRYNQGLYSLERTQTGNYRFIGFPPPDSLRRVSAGAGLDLPALEQGHVYTSYARDPAKPHYYYVAGGPLPLAELMSPECEPEPYLLTTRGIPVPQVQTPQTYQLIDITRKDGSFGIDGKVADDRLYAVYSKQHGGYRVLWIPLSGSMASAAWNEAILTHFTDTI